MHAVRSFMLEFIENVFVFFNFMQTHEKETQLGNYGFLLSPLSCARPPRATRVLKQQQHVV